MSSYARLQSLNSDSKQTTEQINLKPTRVTLAEIEVFVEASTYYLWFFSIWGVKSNKPQNRLQKYNIYTKCNHQILYQNASSLPFTLIRWIKLNPISTKGLGPRYKESLTHYHYPSCIFVYGHSNYLLTHFFCPLHTLWSRVCSIKASTGFWEK